ncbi:MAG TPA: hypothetical protein VJ579_02395 [Candidatus Paceibacterota bacterium]|nr:hypothetical protein [Candidatus Paceibacterota bacterium]
MTKNPKNIFVPDAVLDLQRLSMKQATAKLKNLRSSYKKGTKVRILIGKGGYGSAPPEIPTLTKKFLTNEGYAWSYAKPVDGGDGALDCIIE